MVGGCDRAGFAMKIPSSTRPLEAPSTPPSPLASWPVPVAIRLAREWRRLGRAGSQLPGWRQLILSSRPLNWSSGDERFFGRRRLPTGRGRASHVRCGRAVQIGIECSLPPFALRLLLIVGRSGPALPAPSALACQSGQVSARAQGILVIPQRAVAFCISGLRHAFGFQLVLGPLDAPPTQKIAT